jgi:hypothetical protein
MVSSIPPPGNSRRLSTSLMQAALGYAARNAQGLAPASSRGGVYISSAKPSGVLGRRAAVCVADESRDGRDENKTPRPKAFIEAFRFRIKMSI